MNPKVSFVIPCYKLAHLLPDCVHSILAQTYRDFEVLIMDDCSPDDTPEVAKSFQDPRVKHIRNEPNLGHIRNFNKGISLAAGKYVWLISADDLLRVPYVLERYVKAMEQHPGVAYAFCPAAGLEGDQERGMLSYSVYGRSDAIVAGRRFVRDILRRNFVVTPSVMVRKTCYDKVGLFPVDMPYAGDWYMWCLLPLHYDVAYFAEPMVSYRQHDESITNALMSTKVRLCIEDDLAVLWRIKQKAEEAGRSAIAKRCRNEIAYEYARHITGKKYVKVAGGSMSLAEAECSLHRHAGSAAEEQWIRARMYMFVGEVHFRQQDFRRTLEFYRRGLREDPWMIKVWSKRFLLHTGTLGFRLRQHVFALRQAASGRSGTAERRHTL